VGKTKVLEDNLSQCDSVHHKSQMDWPGNEQGHLKGWRFKASAMARHK